MTSSPSEPSSTRAFVGLGSNLGDRWAHLRRAVDQLRGGSGVPVTAEDQGPYLNVVVELALPPRFDAYRLLTECHRLEASAGRVRTVRWGPRTLDVDVLWIDGVTLDDPDLTVPHPRMWERRFVVAPLADLAPDLAGPVELETSGGDVAKVGTL